MNRIVKEHYPVEKLPADLREGFPAGAKVRVTLLVENGPRDEALLEELDRKLNAALRDIEAGRGLTPEDVAATLEAHAAMEPARRA
jgi:hypothetical protein